MFGLIANALNSGGSGGGSNVSLAEKIHAMPTIYEGTICQSYNYKIKYGYFSEDMGQFLNQSWNVNYDSTTSGTHVENYAFTNWQYFYRLFFEIYRNGQTMPDYITYMSIGDSYYKGGSYHSYDDKVGTRDIGGLPSWLFDITSMTCEVSRVKTSSGNGYTYTIKLVVNNKSDSYYYFEDSSQDYVSTFPNVFNKTLTVTNFQTRSDVILNCNAEQYKFDCADMFYQVSKE